MARKRGNGLLLAGLAAGAYAYFSKKENRDKAAVAFNNMKTKVESFVESQKLNRSDAVKPGHSDPYDLQDNKMVSEGSQTSVHYYNQEVQDKSKDSEEDGLYRKQQTADLTGMDEKADEDKDQKKTDEDLPKHPSADLSKSDKQVK